MSVWLSVPLREDWARRRAAPPSVPFLPPACQEKDTPLQLVLSLSHTHIQIYCFPFPNSSHFSIAEGKRGGALAMVGCCMPGRGSPGR